MEPKLRRLETNLIMFSETPHLTFYRINISAGQHPFRYQNYGLIMLRSHEKASLLC